MKERGIILVVSGPSGVGKDTVINIITSASDFAKLPTCTTRKPRPGEINGVHYHFVDETAFISLHNSGKLLDHVVITGNHYGLPLEALGRALDSGKNIAIHLVVGSAFLLKRIIPDAVMVFIMPPSHEDLVQRLRGRGMAEEEIAKRLRDDPTTLQAARFYDFVIVNYDGEEQETAERILRHVANRRGTIVAELPKSSGYNRILYMYPEFFATKNINKLREVNEILDRSLEQIAVDLYEPQGLDVAEVIREKTEDAFRKTGKFVLVEDTALEFRAWNGLPGALIKWFLETVGNEGLLKMLAGVENRRAVAKTAVGFFDGNKAHVFVGEIEGTIPETIRGSGGFGWDPIFIPDGFNKSFAEMTSEEKNAVSMRRRALERMKESLK
ncbi:MAG: RdgB/HAM1 family non-canonical purine NTP pyrophosphatase [Patescibacteria group bacterium]